MQPKAHTLAAIRVRYAFNFFNSSPLHGKCTGVAFRIKEKKVSARAYVRAHSYQFPTPFPIEFRTAPIQNTVQMTKRSGYLFGVSETALFA